MGLKTSKNFITTNAVQNITSVPKQPPKIYVDTRGGNKNLLEPSGLEPVYTNKKVFIYISIFWQTDKWWCRWFNFKKNLNALYLMSFSSLLFVRFLHRLSLSLSLFLSLFSPSCLQLICTCTCMSYHFISFIFLHTISDGTNNWMPIPTFYDQRNTTDLQLFIWKNQLSFEIFFYIFLYMFW